MWGSARNSPTSYNDVAISSRRKFRVDLWRVARTRMSDDIKILFRRRTSYVLDGTAKFDDQCRGHGSTAAAAAVA